VTDDEGRVVAFCPTCLREWQRIIGEARPEELERLLAVLADLDEHEMDALLWSDERRAAWKALPDVERVIIGAVSHVSVIWEGQKFRAIDLPAAVQECIQRTSRAALFTTLGMCVKRICGDMTKIGTIYELFDWEEFEPEAPGEPLASYVATCTREALATVICECLDVLLGTYAWGRLRARTGKKGLSKVSRDGDDTEKVSL
jgi:hypothetical protein